MLVSSLVLLCVLFSQSCAYDENSSGSDDVRRPCETNNLNCIRCFLAKKTGCTPVYKPVTDNLIFPRLELAVPQANLTFIALDYVLEEVNNYEIKQFYENRTSGNLVFEIEFKEFKWHTSSATFRYHLKGKEPVELTDCFTLQQKSISLTLVLPLNHCTDMSKGHVLTYIEDPNIHFEAGPNVVNSDPVIQAAYKAFTKKYITTFKEGYLVAGTAVMWSFIQHAICDFHKDASNN